MTEIVSAFGSEVFRPIVTLLLPGAISITPWFILARVEFPRFSTLVTTNPTEAALAFVGTAIAMGFVLEDAGSEIEDRWDRNASNAKERTEVWERFLLLAYSVEPIGQRYIRSMVLRLKFELGCFCAIWLALPGTLWVGLLLGGRANWQPSPASAIALIVIALAMLAILPLLWKWARDGNEILFEVRKSLVDKYGVGQHGS